MERKVAFELVIRPPRANRKAGCRPSRLRPRAHRVGGRGEFVSMHCSMPTSFQLVCLLWACRLSSRADCKSRSGCARAEHTNLGGKWGKHFVWGWGAHRMCVCSCMQRRQSNARIILYNIRPCELSSVAATGPRTETSLFPPPERGGGGAFAFQNACLFFSVSFFPL